LIAASGPTTICQGESVVLSTTQLYSSYTWSTGQTTPTITVSAGGSFSVSVTDANGCPGNSSPQIVTVNPLPTATLSAIGSTDLCPGQAVVLQAPAGFGAYLWNTGQTTPSISVNNAGNYHVRVTDANGCQNNSDTLAVRGPSPRPLLSSAGGSTIICPTDSLLVTASPAIFAQYEWFQNGSLVASGSSSLQVKTPGAVHLRVTDTLGCQLLSDTLIFNDFVIPNLSANGPTTFCQGGNVVLDAGPGYVTYLWNTGANTRTLTVAASGSYFCTVSGTGCQANSDTIAVTVHPLPVPVIQPSGPTTFCIGGTVDLSTTQPYVSYQWSTGETTANITISTSGNYSVTVTDANGCVNTSTATVVTVNPLPTPVVQPSGPTTFCDGESVVLSTALPYNSYVWSTGETTPTITVATGGNYSVAVVDANGCENISPSVSITVNPLPLALLAAQSATDLCAGDSVVIRATPGFVAYQWNTGQAVDSIVVYAGGAYYVEVTDLNTCRSFSDTVQVRGPVPAPVLFAGPVLFLCPGDSIVFRAGGNFVSYQWFNDGVAVLDETTDSLVIKDLGQYYVEVIDSLGCIQSSDTIEVEAFTAPFLVAQGPLTFCEGDSVRIRTQAPYQQYLWSTGDTTPTILVRTSGLYSVTVFGFPNCAALSDTFEVVVLPLPEPEITPSNGQTATCVGTPVALRVQPGFVSNLWSDGSTGLEIFVDDVVGQRWYWVEVSDTNGCVNRDSILYRVNPLPAPNLGPDRSFCSNDFSFALDPAVGNAVSWSWNTGESTPTIRPSATGFYNVTVTDVNGCLGRDTVFITVLPAPQPLLPDTTYLCAGNFLVLRAGNTGSTYQWSNGHTLENLLVTAPGTYSVTITSPDGCVERDTTVVLLGSAPTVDLGPDRGLCPGGSVLLNATHPSAVRYEWLGGQTTPTLAATQAGFYVVTVYGTNNCYARDTVRVFDVPQPVVNLGGSLTICDGQAAILDAGNPGANYIWNTGESSQTITPTTSGTYWVEVSFGGVCLTSDTVSVTLLPRAGVALTLPDTVNAGESFTVSAAGGQSYVWRFGTNPVTELVAGADPRTLTLTRGGMVLVSVEVLAGDCIYTFTDSIFVIGPSSTENPLAQLPLVLYPNPTDGWAYLQGLAGMESGVELTLWNAQGQLVRRWTEQPTNQDRLPIDLTGLAKGLYRIQIEARGHQLTMPILLR
jgi:predicted RNase H-like HicB family nuclease